MPQSLTFLLVHVIFSTKDRAPIIPDAIKPNLHAYLATVARNAGCECLRVGGWWIMFIWRSGYPER